MLCNKERLDDVENLASNNSGRLDDVELDITRIKDTQQDAKINDINNNFTESRIIKVSTR